MPWCKVCGGLIIDGFGHKCPPKWLVRREEWDGEDATEIRAVDAEEAAKKWAEDDDQSSAEYGIVSKDEEPVVIVCRADSGEETRWRVSGEAVPAYYAEPVSQ